MREAAASLTGSEPASPTTSSLRRSPSVLQGCPPRFAAGFLIFHNDAVLPLILVCRAISHWISHCSRKTVISTNGLVRKHSPVSSLAACDLRAGNTRFTLHTLDAAAAATCTLCLRLRFGMRPALSTAGSGSTCSSDRPKVRMLFCAESIRVGKW